MEEQLFFTPFSVHQLFFTIFNLFSFTMVYQMPKGFGVFIGEDGSTMINVSFFS